MLLRLRGRWTWRAVVKVGLVDKMVDNREERIQGTCCLAGIERKGATVIVVVSLVNEGIDHKATWYLMCTRHCSRS